MTERNREKTPRPVDRERALQHARLAIRRHWAGDVPGFERWHAAEIDPKPEAVPELKQEPAPEHAAGDLNVPEGYHVLAGEVDGRSAVGVVVSRFNGEITDRLLKRALDELDEVGVPREAIMIMPVPGAFKLPLAAIATGRADAVLSVEQMPALIVKLFGRNARPVSAHAPWGEPFGSASPGSRFSS